LTNALPYFFKLFGRSEAIKASRPDARLLLILQRANSDLKELIKI
jgi:hypothetical protein